MPSDVIAVLGTLGGVAIGFVGQSIQRRWQKNRDIASARQGAYAVYLSAADAYFRSLVNLSWAVKYRSASDQQLIDRGTEADQQLAELTSAEGPAAMLAVGSGVPQALASTTRRLRRIHRQLYVTRLYRDEESQLFRLLPNEHGWEFIYHPAREDFIHAVQTDLRLAGGGSGLPGARGVDMSIADEDDAAAKKLALIHLPQEAAQHRAGQVRPWVIWPPGGADGQVLLVLRRGGA